jgi:hypothetical protein
MGSTSELEQVAGYAEGIYWRESGPQDGATIEILSAEHATGVCDAFGGLWWEDVVRATEKRRIAVTTLFQMLDEKKKK